MACTCCATAAGAVWLTGFAELQVERLRQALTNRQQAVQTAEQSRQSTQQELQQLQQQLGHLQQSQQQLQGQLEEALQSRAGSQEALHEAKSKVCKQRMHNAFRNHADQHSQSFLVPDCGLCVQNSCASSCAVSSTRLWHIFATVRPVG